MNNQQELMKEHESCEFHLVTIAEIIIMQMKPGAMRNEKWREIKEKNTMEEFFLKDKLLGSYMGCRNKWEKWQNREMEWY